MGFKRSGMVVKLHAFDADLGGRNFDELVFEHFCDEIKEKNKIDIRSNKKASFKLRTACEKVCACASACAYGWGGGEGLTSALSHCLIISRLRPIPLRFEPKCMRCNL